MGYSTQIQTFSPTKHTLNRRGALGPNARHDTSNSLLILGMSKFMNETVTGNHSAEPKIRLSERMLRKQFLKQLQRNNCKISRKKWAFKGQRNTASPYETICRSLSLLAFSCQEDYYYPNNGSELMSANKDNNGEIFRSFQICLRSVVEITWFTIQFSLAVLLMSTYSYLSCPHNLLELQLSLNDSGFCPYHRLHFFSSSGYCKTSRGHHSETSPTLEVRMDIQDILKEHYFPIHKLFKS